MALSEKFRRENLVGRFPPIKKWGKVAYLKDFDRESLIKRRNIIQRKDLRELIEEIPTVVSLQTRKMAMNLVAKACEDIRMGKVVNSKPLKKIVKDMVEEILTNHPESMMRLTKIKSFDDYTFAHSVNVSILSTIIGVDVGLSREKLEELALGAMLHDLGKTKIDHKILQKPTSLTEQEFGVVRRHPEDGYQMLLSDLQNGHVARIVARQHHERQDGSGYPEGLKGNEINDFASIAAVADVYDALTTDRPYRKKFLPYVAMEIIIAASGLGLKKKIVAAFLSMMSIYPQGSLVRLNTGEIAMVTRANRRAVIRPAIKLLIDVDGHTLKESVEIDLLTQPHRYIIGYVDDEILPEEIVA